MNNPFETKHYPNLSESFGVIGLVLLASIVISIPFMGVKYLASDIEDINSIISLLGYLIPFTIVSVYLYKKIKKQDSNFSLKFKFPETKLLLILIPLTLALSIVIEPIVTFIPMPDFVKELFESMITNDIYSLITVAFLAPVLEEIIFRGIILNGLLKNYSPIKAIVWSAALFGIVHLNPWQFIGAFIIGLVIGWIYWKTNSIIPGILIHFVNNFTASMVMMFSNDVNATTKQLFGGDFNYLMAYVFSAIIITLSFLYLYNTFNKKEKANLIS